MKNKLYFIICSLILSSFLLISFLPISDISEKENFKISYALEYYKFKDSNTRKKTSMVLLQTKNRSLFTTNKLYELDSIRHFRDDLSAMELMNYSEIKNYTVISYKDSIFFKESIGDVILAYSEKEAIKWSLKKDTKNILGYQCKKAETSYGGRTWTAWYTLKLPIQNGPYKFNGLPGLIVELTDSDEIFKFTLKSVKRTKNDINDNFINYFLDEECKVISSTRKDANRFREKIDKMSLNEKMQYMNRDQPGNFSVVISDQTGTPNISQRKPRIRNYFEIDL